MKAIKNSLICLGFTSLGMLLGWGLFHGGASDATYDATQGKTERVTIGEGSSVDFQHLGDKAIIKYDDLRSLERDNANNWHLVNVLKLHESEGE